MAHDLAHSEEWKAWFRKSYSQLEAQYGLDALMRAESKHHALEDNRFFAELSKTVLAAASSHGLCDVIKTRDAIRADAPPGPASPIYLGSIG